MTAASTAYNDPGDEDAEVFRRLSRPYQAPMMPRRMSEGDIPVFARQLEHFTRLNTGRFLDDIGHAITAVQNGWKP